jgi:ADP-ribose pyrophosphatase YjhB (NUDIX family)
MNPLQHRIRAAGLLVREQSILLVRHEVDGDVYWIPPGGGFESHSDRSTRDTVKRECRE